MRDNFSHAMPRRLTAEAVDGCGRKRDRLRARRSLKFPKTPTRRNLPDPHVGKDGFLDLFGRPSRESACECERRADLSLPQALNLINGKTISDAVADPNGRVTKSVLAGKGDAAMVEDLYLATLSRLPTKAEAESGLKYLSGGARGTRAQDLLWALLNSKGFLYSY